jgi:hypothetical protein
MTSQVPIFIQLQESVLPSDIVVNADPNLSYTTNYYLNIKSPTGKKNRSSIASESKLALKTLNNLKTIRVALVPSVGIGQTSCYKVELTKVTNYQGLLLNQLKPNRSYRPPEKIEVLDTWYWRIPNLNKTYNLSYETENYYTDPRINYKQKAETKVITLQPNGTSQFDLSEYPEIIIINSVFSQNTEFYSYSVNQDPNTLSDSFSISLDLLVIPTEPINIEYYVPLTMEDILYIEHPRSHISIAY